MKHSLFFVKCDADFGHSDWGNSGRKTAVVFIVLNVLIVTRCLNEAIAFSLINAVQFLSISIMEKTAVVFIVLIVLIVTLCLSEAMPFSLINVVQSLYPQNKNRPSVCGDFKPSSFAYV